MEKQSGKRDVVEFISHNSFEIILIILAKVLAI